MPKASVIVPVYNVAPFLPDCLDSLLAVPFQDMEVLLVIDGAADESPAIAERYAARDRRFRLVRRENGGLSAARNTGIEASDGEYLFFLDGDDMLEPALIGDAIQAAESTGAQQVVWNYRYLTDGALGPAQLPMRDGLIDTSAGHLADYFYRYWFPYRHGQEAWARLYRRDLLDAHGLRFEPNDEIFAEDTLMTGSLLLYTDRLAVLGKPYVRYRQRSGSIMGKPKPHLARRLMELCGRYAGRVQGSPRARELRNVLPMICYRLMVKGIALDPSEQDILEALREYASHPALAAQMARLKNGMALPLYLLHTGKGIRTQWRGRAFAGRFLAGDAAGALALVDRGTHEG